MGGAGKTGSGPQSHWARRKLASGQVWPLADSMVIAGPGEGHQCCICGESITKTDTDYEVAGPSQSVHSHVPCYHAWHWESQQSD